MGNTASSASSVLIPFVPSIYDLPWPKEQDFGIGTTVRVTVGPLMWFGPACSICNQGHPGVAPQDCRVNANLMDWGQLGSPSHKLEF